MYDCGNYFIIKLNAWFYSQQGSQVDIETIKIIDKHQNNKNRHLAATVKSRKKAAYGPWTTPEVCGLTFYLIDEM